MSGNGCVPRFNRARSDQHRYLHNSVALNGNHDAKRAAVDLDLDLLLISGAPLNHAGRTQA